MSKRTKLTCAKQFLLDELSHNASSSTRLVRRAAKQGIGQATLYRAARILGVCQKSCGFGGSRSSLWMMGTDELQRLKSLESFTDRHFTKLIWLTEQALEKSPTSRDTNMLNDLILELRRRKKAV